MHPRHRARPDRCQYVAERLVLGDLGIGQFRVLLAHVNGSLAEDLDNGGSETGLALEQLQECRR